MFYVNYYLNNCGLVRDRVHYLSDRFLEESEDGPGDRGEDSGGTDQKQQQPHLLDGDRVISSVALGEERMGIRIVPYRPGSVEVLASDGEVNDLDDAVREEEHRDRIGREIVDIGALDYQIHAAQTELQQQQKQVHLKRAKFTRVRRTSGCHFFRSQTQFESKTEIKLTQQYTLCKYLDELSS